MSSYNFTPFPGLATQNLLLRQLTEKDIDSIFAIRSDKKIAEYLDRPLCKSIEEALAFINKVNKGISDGETIYWAVCDNKSMELAGTICLWNISEKETAADVGFELLTEFQGKGIMQEALDSVIEFGFNVMKLKYILGEVDPRNIKSIRLMEKKGFVLLPDAPDAKTIIYRLCNPGNINF